MFNVNKSTPLFFLDYVFLDRLNLLQENNLINESEWKFHISHSQTFNLNVNGKSHCCDSTFSDVHFTLLIAKNIFEIVKLLLSAENQHFLSYINWKLRLN